MPKILWISPYSLHDISSGASIHCKTQLEGLVKRGFEVWSCSSFIFDVPNGARLFPNLKEKLENSSQNVFEMDEKGIHYVYTRCRSTFETDNTLAEQELHFQVYLEVLDRFAPDFVMAFGTDMGTMTCFAEAKRRGIFTIYHVMNGNHGHYSFPDIDIILTDSKATQQLYRSRDHIRLLTTGALFDTSLFLAKKREPKYVTYINPSFEKGLCIFAKLAMRCKTEMPDVRFLVVNSRGNFAENVQYLHAKGDKNKHPFTPKDFSNVDMTPGTNNMRPIYGSTKALIAPSLWWESWGRVTTEAVFNNIPVLASNSGGLPEAIGGAGFNLQPPAHCIQDYLSIPDDDEIEPWFDALKHLLNDDWSEKLAKAQDQLSIEKCLDRTIEILLPYIQQRKRESIAFNHYGYLN